MQTSERKRNTVRRRGGRRSRGGFPKWAALLLVLAALAAGALLLNALRRDQRPANALGTENIQPDWTYLDDSGQLRSYRDAASGVASRVGIDVSVHQGEIDWRQVADAGVEFAMLRLGFRGSSTGALTLDNNFVQNARGAAEAGIPIGVYFYSQAVSEEEAQEEAEYVLRELDGLEVTFPVAYDLEEYPASGARTEGLTGEQATKNAAAFCRKIEEAGYLPAVYTNADWASGMYDLESLSPTLIWYADYREAPSLAGGFSMWQYSEKGTLPGVESRYVDLDLLFFRETD